MKTKIRTLFPIKIQNRLVPKQVLNSPNGSPTNDINLISQPLTITRLKSSDDKNYEPMSPGRKINTQPDKTSSAKVPIRRSETISRSSIQSDSDSCHSDIGVEVSRPTYSRTRDYQLPEYYYVTRNQPQISFQSSSKSNQFPSSEYYTNIDKQINNGIKKLQQMDKKFQAYDSRHNFSQIKVQKELYPTGVNKSQTIVQLKQQQVSIPKTKQQLQLQLSNKKKKIEELQNQALESNKKIAQLESQSQALNSKLMRLQQNAKKYSEDEQRYKKTINYLYNQIKNLDNRNNEESKRHEEQKLTLQKLFQQKIVETNIKMQQMKEFFQNKQKQLISQIRKEQDRESQQQLQQNELQMERFYQKQIARIIEANSNCMDKLKQEHLNQIKQYREQYEIDIETEKGHSHKVIQSLSKKLNQQISNSRELSKKLQSKTRQTIEIEAQLESKKNQLVNALAQVKTKKEGLQELALIQSQNSRQIATLQQQLEQQNKNSTQKYLDILKQLEKLKEELDEKEKLITNMNQNFENKLLKQKQLLDSSNQTCQKYAQNNQKHQQEIKNLHKKNTELQLKIQNYQKQVQQNEAFKREKQRFMEKQKECKQYISLIQKLKIQILQLQTKFDQAWNQKKQVEIRVAQITALYAKSEQRQTQQMQQMKLQQDAKSKQIFQKLTDYFQQKQRLTQQIINYRSKIQQKEKQLNEQGYKIHQIQRLIKNNLKEVSINKHQYDRLNKLILEYQNQMLLIEKEVVHFFEQIKAVFSRLEVQGGLRQRQKQSEKQKQKHGENAMIGQKQRAQLVQQTLRFALQENKKLVEKHIQICIENKKLRQHKFNINVPERDISSIIQKAKAYQNGQQKLQKLYPVLVDSETITQKAEEMQASKDSIGVGTEQLMLNNQQTQTLGPLQFSNKKEDIIQAYSIQVSHPAQKLENEAQTVGEAAGKIVINSNTISLQILPAQDSRVKKQKNQPSKILQSEDEQNNLSHESSLIIDQGYSLQDLKIQIHILQQQLQNKEHIIQVMENCIDDYKNMVKGMKQRLQVQEITEHYYADILDFFEVNTNVDHQTAHEQLLDTITTFTSKLQKMVQTVTCLESQLTKSNQENIYLNQKKKKMIRELKRCEQMIQKACHENEQLEQKVNDLSQKIELGDNYVRGLVKLINENSQQIMRVRLTIANFKWEKALALPEQIQYQQVHLWETEPEVDRQFLGNLSNQEDQIIKVQNGQQGSDQEEFVTVREFEVQSQQLIQTNPTLSLPNNEQRLIDLQNIKEEEILRHLEKQIEKEDQEQGDRTRVDTAQKVLAESQAVEIQIQTGKIQKAENFQPIQLKQFNQNGLKQKQKASQVQVKQGQLPTAEFNVMQDELDKIEENSENSKLQKDNSQSKVLRSCSEKQQQEAKDIFKEEQQYACAQPTRTIQLANKQSQVESQSLANNISSQTDQISLGCQMQKNLQNQPQQNQANIQFDIRGQPEKKEGNNYITI